MSQGYCCIRNPSTSTRPLTTLTVSVCRQCGSREEIHFDHVIPWSRGGANTADNIQLLCGRCNRRKSDKWQEA